MKSITYDSGQSDTLAHYAKIISSAILSTGAAVTIALLPQSGVGSTVSNPIPLTEQAPVSTLSQPVARLGLNRRSSKTPNESVITVSPQSNTVPMGDNIMITPPNNPRVNQNTGSTITSQSRQLLGSMSEHALAKQALGLLGHLDAALVNERIYDLPPIRLFNMDDGSLFLEWIVRGGRAGFNFEMDSSQSGWFILSNNHVDREWGDSSSLNLDVIVKKISQYHK